MQRRRFGRSWQRLGTTLVEILIAVGVLSLFIGLLYTLMGQLSSSGSVGIWRENTSREIRTATMRIRKIVGEACYPHGVTPISNSTAKHEGYFVTVASGGESECDLETPHAGGYQCRNFRASGVGEEQVLMTCYHSTQARKGLSGFPDQKGKVTRYVLALRKGEAIRGRHKRAEAGDCVKDLCVGSAETEFDVDGDFLSKRPDEPCITTDTAAYVPGEPDEWKTLCRGVTAVQVCCAMSEAKSEPESSPFVEIRLTCIEPHEGKAMIRETVKIRPQTGVLVE